MKKPVLLISTLFFFLLSMTAQNKINKYEDYWEKVTQFEKDDLPQSAAKVVDDILQKSIADKNIQQVIKAYLHKDKYKIIIDRSDNTAIFADLQNLVSITPDNGEKALLHSILAELYSNYYSSNRWNINQLTTLSDVVPDDMKEWTVNIFMDKIMEHLDASLVNSPKLKELTTKEFDDIVLLGNDSPEYYPAMYDFLMKRAINIAQNIKAVNGNDINIEDTGLTVEQATLATAKFIKLKFEKSRNNLVLYYFQQYLRDLSDRNASGSDMSPTIMLTEIARADYVSNISNSFKDEKAFDFLKQVANEYPGNAATIELRSGMIKVLLRSNTLKEDKRNESVYNIATEGIKKYPDYKRIDILKDYLYNIERPDFNVKAEELYYPQKMITVEVTSRNLQSLDKYPNLQLVKIAGKDTVLVKEIPLRYKTDKTYIYRTDKVNIGQLEAGLYAFLSQGGTDTKNAENSYTFRVSQLASYYRNNAKNECEVYVVDRQSGKPLQGATVDIYKIVRDNEDIKIANAATNNIGLAQFKNISEINSKDYNNLYYKVSYGKDSYLQDQRLYTDYEFTNTIATSGLSDLSKKGSESNSSGRMSIFIDRNIYRPGQTVYFKAIAVNSGFTPEVGKTVKVVLYNTNNEVVSEKSLTTNEFGSVSGDFTIPQSGLLGQYNIEANSNYPKERIYFRVEEYKRPTFDITFDKIDETYSFGQEITIKGYAKSFSGINLQDANVDYTINGRPMRFWGWDSGGSTYENGTVTTAADGSFLIKFTPQARDISTVGILRKNIYNYAVNASVTDLNGETQSNSLSVVVSDISMVVNIDLPEQIEKSDTAKINITAKNLNGQDIKTSGKYAIYSLDKNDSIRTKILDGAFTETGIQPLIRNQINSLVSGKYRIKITALDSKKIEVESEKDFILFSYNDKHPPIETNEWLVEKNTTFGNGKDAEILFGVSDKDVYVLYQIYNRKKIFSRELLLLNNANRLFTIPYKSEYENGVSVSLTYVKKGKFYNKQVELRKEEVKRDTELVLKLESFRDKMYPGDEEKWIMVIKDKNGKPVSAEILASMYDMSLDKISGGYYDEWTMNLPSIGGVYDFPATYNTMLWGYDTYRYYRPAWLYSASKNKMAKAFSFDRINWYGFDFRFPKLLPSQDLEEVVVIGYGTYQDNIYTGSGDIGLPLSSRANDQVEFSAGWRQTGMIGKLSLTKAKVEPSKRINNEEMDTDDENITPQIRRNFNETAFFFPLLRTNEKGETLISFTAPESNTTWRFRAFAHDKDLKSGLLQQYVVTRKELMVMPNMPRFIRQGDKTNISTKISNLSDGAISGNVYIEFFDPATEKIIDLNIRNRTQSFSLEKDASVSVNWTFDVPGDIELLGCRIVAGNNTFSDGEQHTLAVLPNRILVTESLPMDVSKQGETQFKLEKLINNSSNSLSNYRLTLEFTTNPAWYAVLALPTLSTPDSENVLSWFGSYYVNRLGQSIMQRYPRVQAMIELWKKQGGDKETLLSNLQKDEELKNVLLSETPWVLEAKNETEQMQRLSLLFDLNSTNQKLDLATKKLAELQDPTGGWRWYNGMYPSRSITQYLLFAFADLKTYGQVDFGQEIKQMQMNAIRFIDAELKKEYESLKKNNKNWQNIKSISTTQLEYLSVRNSYRDIPIDQETREAERFYTSVASKNWKSLNLYERSILSVVLQGLGEKQLSDQIVKSIRERAVVNSKQGMYWPNNTNHTFLTMSAVCNHVFLMKALMDSGSATQKEIDLMKQWLIKQKQTQVWESTNATIDAINMLLSSGSDWLAEDNTNTVIKVGGETVNSDSHEAGTGYIKTTWNKSEITNNMGNVSLTRPNDQPAYGALYWQYYEDLEKITSQKNSEFNVEKQLFKEMTGSTGKNLVSITEDSPLSIGDRVVVRLTVKVANDMEFVQLKDMRAPCFEPVNTVSGTQWRGEAVYYQETRDASTNFYFDQLRKGTYVFEYSVYVNRTGEYSNGITTIQCLYAPEFISHTQGIKVTVK